MVRQRRGLGIALAITAALTVTGCSGDMNTDDVETRIVEATGLNGARVELQHPDAPWNTKIVIWMLVDDDSAEAVAEDVRDVAAFAVDDPDLGGHDLTVAAVKGEPADFPDRSSLVLSAAYVMGPVAALVGGKGAEDFLELDADDVRRLAR